MSVRLIILLLALPLFLLLAAVNSALLYREDTADMEAGLRNEALAAAVTVAEFARRSADPFADLAEPRRLAALHHVDDHIAGLEALYVTAPGRDALNLLGRPIAEVRRDAPPARAQVLGTRKDRNGRHLITALAPIGRGMMVVADIDAEPLVRRAFHLKRMSIALIGGSAILAMLIGLFVARRVIGEFRRTRAIIEAGGSHRQDAPLAIREVRDLADAVHLIDSSVASELRRLGKGAAPGNPAVGIAAARARHFPDVSEIHGGIHLSIRTLPGAPMGCFHIHQAYENGFHLILGKIEDEPARALASAIALKSYVLAGTPEEFSERADAACRAFGAGRIVDAVYTGDELVGIYNASFEKMPGMAGYAARNPGLSTEELTKDLAILFPDAGIIAAAKPVVGAGEAVA